MEKEAEGGRRTRGCFQTRAISGCALLRERAQAEARWGQCREADFEVPVRHVSRDGPAGSCFCGAGIRREV